MARRRIISEAMISDEDFNGLSLEAQNLFLRMLAIADDCGVVPGVEYTLLALTNPPPQVRKKIGVVLHEIIAAGLGRMIEHEGKPWFAFKGNSFLSHQGHILNHRKRSEYLKISANEYDSSTFPDFPGFSCPNVKISSSVVESRKQRVESREQKETAPEKLQDVQVLFAERNYPKGEAEKFWHYYEANGWKVGRNPMKDWKAAAAGWVMRSREFTGIRRPGVIEQPRQRSTFVCALCNTAHRVGDPCPPKHQAMDLVNSLAEEKRVK